MKRNPPKPSTKKQDSRTLETTELAHVRGGHEVGVIERQETTNVIERLDQVLGG